MMTQQSLRMLTMTTSILQTGVVTPLCLKSKSRDFEVEHLMAVIEKSTHRWPSYT